MSDHDPWRDKLDDEQYAICRCGGTERAFTGKYWNHKGDGLYLCACCGEPLFDSAHKYDSGSGWPSFWQALRAEAIEERRDSSHGMIRTEVRCAGCGSHLGHLFPDGPPPSGLRYCINSASLEFRDRD